MKLGVTHHTLVADQLSADKPLVFLMDAPKIPVEKKKGKKKNDLQLNHKNFGSILDVVRLKNAARIAIGWRVRRVQLVNRLSWTLAEFSKVSKQCCVILMLLCIMFPLAHPGLSAVVLISIPGRLDCNSADGVKTIVPIRPICIFSSTMDLTDQVVGVLA